jgi:hypothetical protein
MVDAMKLPPPEGWSDLSEIKALATVILKGHGGPIKPPGNRGVVQFKNDTLWIRRTLQKGRKKGETRRYRFELGLRPVWPMLAYTWPALTDAGDESYAHARVRMIELLNTMRKMTLLESLALAGGSDGQE